MIIVIFLPGGLMEGFNRIRLLVLRLKQRSEPSPGESGPGERAPEPAE